MEGPITSLLIHVTYETAFQQAECRLDSIWVPIGTIGVQRWVVIKTVFRARPGWLGG